MMKRLIGALTVLSVALVGAVHAQDAAKLKVGDAAPDFTIPEGVAIPMVPTQIVDSAFKANELNATAADVPVTGGGSRPRLFPGNPVSASKICTSLLPVLKSFCNTKATVHYVGVVLQRFGYDA